MSAETLMPAKELAVGEAAFLLSELSKHTRHSCDCDHYSPTACDCGLKQVLVAIEEWRKKIK